MGIEDLDTISRRMNLVDTLEKLSQLDKSKIPNDELLMLELLRKRLKPQMTYSSFENACIDALFDFSEKTNHDFNESMAKVLIPMVREYLSKEFIDYITTTSYGQWPL